MAFEFKEKYPDGMKQTIRLFDLALHRIMYTDEIDKVIMMCDDRKEREYLQELKEEFRKKEVEWHEIHWIPTNHAIESPALFRDIIAWMVSLDDLEVYREDKKDG